MGKAESGLSSAMNDHGVQRCRMAIRPNDHSVAREGPGTEVLFALGGSAVRRLAEEILPQHFALPALRTFLPFCRNW